MPCPFFSLEARVVSCCVDVWRVALSRMTLTLTYFVSLFMQRAEINNRGYTFIVPIGKTTTQHEEKNDVSRVLVCQWCLCCLMLAAPAQPSIANTASIPTRPFSLHLPILATALVLFTLTTTVLFTLPGRRGLRRRNRLSRRRSLFPRPLRRRRRRFLLRAR